MPVTTKLDPASPDIEVIERAASVIRNGGLVAFPTETVYGLGADAMNDQAIERIFLAKGRPSNNPLIVHVSDREMLARVAEKVSKNTEKLIDKFWPGPLTLVLKRRAEVVSAVSAGLDTVAVRMPQGRIALELISRSQTPIAAPSANLSGKPSPTEASHVERDLSGRIDMIIDGGQTRIGIESTVLDMTSEPPMILRPGWITREQIAEVIGSVDIAFSEEELKRSPGTLHKHYSPQARVILIESASPELIEKTCREHLLNGRVAFLGHSQVNIDNSDFYSFALKPSAEEYARSIYGALRELDDKNPRVIIIEGISENGEGAAVMDRLRRAASEVIVAVNSGQ
jgi:L-threonylcarbamoyladenylate synthase